MQRSYPCAQGRAGVGSLLASQQQASLLRRNLLTIASRESHGKSARKRRGSSHVPRRPLMPSHSLPIMLSSVPPSSAGDPEYQPPDPAPPPFPDPTEPQPTPNEPELPPSQPPPGATGRRRQGRAGERRPIPATGAADARGHPSLAAGWLPAIEWRGRRARAGRVHLHRTLRRVPRRLRLRRVRAGLAGLAGRPGAVGRGGQSGQRGRTGRRAALTASRRGSAGFEPRGDHGDFILPAGRVQRPFARRFGQSRAAAHEVS